jgi:hypothetical protein
VDYCAICGLRAIARCQGRCGGRTICGNHTYAPGLGPGHTLSQQRAYATATTANPVITCSDCKHAEGLDAIAALPPVPGISSAAGLRAQPLARLAVLMLHRDDYNETQISKLMDEVGGFHLAAPALVPLMRNRGSWRSVDVDGRGSGVVLRDMTSMSGEGYGASFGPRRYVVLGPDGFTWTYHEPAKRGLLRSLRDSGWERQGPSQYDYETAGMCQGIRLEQWRRLAH